MLGLIVLRLIVVALLVGTETQAPAEPTPSFWEKHEDQIIAGVVGSVLTAIFLLFLDSFLKPLLASWAVWLRHPFKNTVWRFIPRYRQALIERHSGLRVIGFPSRPFRRFRLNEAFVPLRLSTTGSMEAGPSYRWDEVLASHSCIAILGSPGAGKSTLISFLLLIFARHIPHGIRKSLRAPLPLIARLRDLKGGETPNLMDLLVRSTFLGEVPSRFPKSLLRRGKCIIFFDGLDELFDEESQRPVVAAIERFVAEFPKNRFVLTCRTAAWRDQLPFVPYELQPLSNDEIGAFVGKWYKEVLRGEQQASLSTHPSSAANPDSTRALIEHGAARSLLKIIMKDEHLLLLARSPLLLSLITFMHFKKLADLPRRRANLYRRCLDILLKQWDQDDKAFQAPDHVSHEDKLSILETIAFEYLRRGLLEADISTLEEMVEPLLGKLGVKATADWFIRQIWQRSGVLIDQSPERYGFAHRAFQDYLVAKYLINRRREQLLLSKITDERWREIILVAIAEAGEQQARNIVRTLLHHESIEARELEIAGLALAERVELGADLNAEIKRELVSKLLVEEAATTFTRLATALMNADLNAAREWMEQTLRSRDPVRRKRVLELIPSLGESHVQSLSTILSEIVVDRSEDASVRIQAVVAMGEASVQPEVEVWAVFAEMRTHSDSGVRAAATRAWCMLGRHQELGLVAVSSEDLLTSSRYLAPFYIGKFPVTVLEFMRFCECTGYTVNEPHFLKTNRKDDHPVVFVNWFDAAEYAKWFGCTLPEETEWERAASGIEGRAYPWGEWRPGLANTSEHWSKGKTWKNVPLIRTRRIEGSTTAVGRFSPGGDSVYGCADMAGNVWEWTRSPWEETPEELLSRYYVDDSVKQEHSAFALRGGSHVFARSYAQCSYRYRQRANIRVGNIGFRIAVSPQSPDLSRVLWAEARKGGLTEQEVVPVDGVAPPAAANLPTSLASLLERNERDDVRLS